MLDRVDPGADGALRALGPVRVRGRLPPARVRLVDERVQLGLRQLRRATSSFSESTPPVAQTLMTSAPYLMLRRTAARTASGPSATAAAMPERRSKTSGR